MLAGRPLRFASFNAARTLCAANRLRHLRTVFSVTPSCLPILFAPSALLRFDRRGDASFLVPLPPLSGVALLPRASLPQRAERSQQPRSLEERLQSWGDSAPAPRAVQAVRSWAWQQRSGRRTRAQRLEQRQRDHQRAAGDDAPEEAERGGQPQRVTRPRSSTPTTDWPAASRENRGAGLQGSFPRRRSIGSNWAPFPRHVECGGCGGSAVALAARAARHQS